MDNCKFNTKLQRMTHHLRSHPLEKYLNIHPLISVQNQIPNTPPYSKLLANSGDSCNTGQDNKQTDVKEKQTDVKDFLHTFKVEHLTNFEIQPDLFPLLAEQYQKVENKMLYERFPDVLHILANMCTDAQECPAGKSNLEKSYYHSFIAQNLSKLGIVGNWEVPVQEITVGNGTVCVRPCGNLDLYSCEWCVEVKAQKPQEKDSDQLFRYVQAMRSIGLPIKGGILLRFEPNKVPDIKVFPVKNFPPVQSFHHRC